jgi:predicted transcriptional regulator
MDFACKNFDLKEVIRCSLGLTKTDFRILEFLMKNNSKKFSANIISNELKLDLSTVQRSMKKMSEKKLLNKSQINLASGGYNFNYCICEKNNIKDIIKSTIKNWTDNFYREIDRW